ncbi:protein translocase subunit SecF [Rhodoligotrophos defluvii]|uniref:protein translocase subunit SecF n=1 Tax=Rhodoligotrophos defluvii TaxID=2561934 RepID=UPI0010C94765|nr:protein translocase subunit SecF [Rhodoligotrophos defluvii]
MRPIRFIRDDTDYRFMRFARFGYALSGLCMIASVLLFLTVGLNYGIDFEGGTVIEIQTPQPADLAQLRSTVGGLGLGEVEVQGLGQPDQVMIRVGKQEGEQAQQDTLAKVRNALGPDVTYLRTEVVGPKVSGELAQMGTIAVLISMIGILIYIWFRFEWQFALGAILSLVHDVVLTIGLFCLLGIQFNLTIIAAVLTIVGYSLNDTVVVFDRIREYLRKYKSMKLIDLIDLSLNSTLSRTILTSVTAFLAMLSLYVFGGEVLRGFTFAMLWGVIIGTYSSIFVAAPILLLVGVKRDWSAVAEKGSVNVRTGATAAAAGKRGTAAGTSGTSAQRS